MDDYRWRLLKEFSPDTLPASVDLEMIDDAGYPHLFSVTINSNALVLHSEDCQAILIIELGRRQGSVHRGNDFAS